MLIPVLFIAVVVAIYLSRGAPGNLPQRGEETKQGQQEAVKGHIIEDTEADYLIERPETDHLPKETTAPETDNTRFVSVSGVVRFKTGEPAPGQKVEITVFHGRNLTKWEDLKKAAFTFGRVNYDERTEQFLDLFFKHANIELPDYKTTKTERYVISDETGEFKCEFTYTPESNESVDSLLVQLTGPDANADWFSPLFRGGFLSLLRQRGLSTTEDSNMRLYLISKDKLLVEGVVLEVEERTGVELNPPDPGGDIRLSGRVISAADGMPVEGAQIRVEFGNIVKFTTTDETGHFFIDGLAGYSVNLTCYKAGYTCYSKQVDASRFITIVLEKAADLPEGVAEDGTSAGDVAEPSVK